MGIEDPSRFSVYLHEFFWFRLMRGYYRKFVQSFGLSGDERVLDFGCGPGAASRFIAPALDKGGELTCMDISPTWIARARKHLSGLSNVAFYVQDIQQWEANENYYDVIVIHFMLHDVPASNRPDVVMALSAKMKPGARLIIREPSKDEHGLPPAAIRELLSPLGLEEIDGRSTKSFLMRDMFTGIFTKPV